jgi:endothelin-converting enzyme/putative endopeptidase
MRHVQLVAICLILAPALSAQDNGEAGRKPADVRFSPDMLVRSIDPCTDFYAFACSRWQAQNPVPPDHVVWGRLNELQQRGEYIVRDILEQAAVDRRGRTPNEQKIGDYFASCMDDAAIERAGTRPLEPDFQRIASLRSKDALPAEIARLHRQGYKTLFSFGSASDVHDARQMIAEVDQGGLGLRDREHYFKDDARSVELRGKYVAHVQKMFELLGDAPEKAAVEARVVMAIETALARNALDETARRDPQRIYHRTSRQQLAAPGRGFDWNGYFGRVGAPRFDSLNVVAPDYVADMHRLIEATPLDDWKTYLRWSVVHSAAPFLASAFVNEDFSFFFGALWGAKELLPRWKRCVGYASEDLGEAIGQSYVRHTFGEEDKARVLAIVAALERALAEDVKGLSWMGEETKKAALVKLQAISNRIGYPDRWRDYSGLAIVRGDAMGNVRRARLWDLERRIDKIGKTLDKGDWPFPPMTMNAMYDSRQNAITFPAGILQPPLYDNQAHDALNFGGIGAAIGHELTHGFDDQGSQFDADGNLRDWWTADDKKRFEERTRCIEDQYGGYVAIDTLKLNGKLTLGENMADNGGLRIAYMAMLEMFAGKEPAPVDGLNARQLFFLGWANLWCENRTDAIMRLAVAIDPHSPARYRVNGTVSNMPEFREAYKCRRTAPMVNRNACRVW